jgi:uncharacterized protein YbjT (DUF2867 family)
MMKTSAMPENAEIAVIGATGGMGRMVTRALRARGRAVRALTRDPNGAAARALAADGVHVVAADLDDAASLAKAVDGVRSMFCMVPALAKGRYARGSEVARGRILAAAAAAVRVEHVVYGAGGLGRKCGVPHLDTKLDIEEALRAAVPRVNVLLPSPFMELLTDARFFPHVSTWGVEPRVVGWDTPIPWVGTRDIGLAAATILCEPERAVPERMVLCSDVKSLSEARALFVRATGRPPRSQFMPLFLFRFIVGNELPAMWRLIREAPDVVRDPGPTRALVPNALRVEDFLASATA